MAETNEIKTETFTLDELIARAEAAADVALTAQIAYEQTLQDIATYHKPTYEYGGQIYQVRTRKDSVQGRTITYLCKLKDWPASWLSKPKTTPVAVASTPTPTTDPVDVVATTEEQDVPPDGETPVYANVSLSVIPDADTTTVIE